MSIDIRSGADAEDVRAAIAPIWHYFGFAPHEEVVANFTALMTPARTLIAREDAQDVGGCGTFPLRLTVPGGQIDAAGLSMVGVMPTHRRRGILRALIAKVVEDCGRRGEPVAYLWASEERIYGRYGFGLTGLSCDMRIARERAVLPPSRTSALRARLLPLAQATEPLGRIFAAVAERTPGAFTRSADWWQRKTLADPAWRRRGGGEMQCVVLDQDGTACAYALYRINSSIERGVQSGGVEVMEAVGVSPDATQAIWRYLFATDWASWISATYLPVDHPLILSVAEPRHLNLRQRDGAWLRIVDLDATLAARTYGPADIVIEVDDKLCPQNVGRWSIGASGVKRTMRMPDLRCRIDALSCVYLGGFAWRQLVASARAEALHENAVAQADLVFSTHGAPWCPEIF